MLLSQFFILWMLQEHDYKVVLCASDGTIQLISPVYIENVGPSLHSHIFSF